MRGLLLATVAGTCLVATAADAAIQYRFQFGDTIAVFNAPTFLATPFPAYPTPPTIITPLVSCVSVEFTCAGAIELRDEASHFPAIPGYVTIQFTNGAAVGGFAYIDFGRIGTVTAFGATMTVSEAAALPEPATFALLGAGLLGLGIARRRRAG